MIEYCKSGMLYDCKDCQLSKVESSYNYSGGGGAEE